MSEDTRNRLQVSVLFILLFPWLSRPRYWNQDERCNSRQSEAHNVLQWVWNIGMVDWGYFYVITSLFYDAWRGAVVKRAGLIAGRTQQAQRGRTGSHGTETRSGIVTTQCLIRSGVVKSTARKFSTYYRLQVTNLGFQPLTFFEWRKFISLEHHRPLLT